MYSGTITEKQLNKQCLTKAAEIICLGKVQEFSNLSLSRNTMARHINGMANFSLTGPNILPSTSLLITPNHN